MRLIEGMKLDGVDGTRMSFQRVLTFCKEVEGVAMPCHTSILSSAWHPSAPIKTSAAPSRSGDIMCNEREW